MDTSDSHRHYYVCGDSKQVKRNSRDVVHGDKFEDSPIYIRNIIIQSIEKSILTMDIGSLALHILCAHGFQLASLTDNTFYGWFTF